jgi:gluconolactonase
MIAYITLLMLILNGKPVIGSIEVFNAGFQKTAMVDYPTEVIATGSDWAEGPLWVDNDDSMPFLLYSDTVQNKIFRWEEGKGFFTVGKTLYLAKSGCKTDMAYCDSMHEPGSNALIRVFPPAPDNNLDLVMAQHGERAISLQRDNGTRTIIASHFKGKRLNSPNDMAWSPEGHLYFTDTIYGLRRKDQKDGEIDESLKELDSGLYMIHRNDIVRAMEKGIPADNIYLIDGKMNRPNGIAFSPGFSKLYVSNSDPKNAYWKVFDVSMNGLAHKGRMFYNATEMFAENGMGGKESFGNPDGIKTDITGNIYTAGPGGVLVFSSDGELLARLRTDRPVSNLAFDTEGKLYITAKDLILRKKIGTKPPKPLTELRKLKK